MNFDENIYKDILESEFKIKELYYEENIYDNLPEKLGIANAINFNYINGEAYKCDIHIQIICFDGGDKDLNRRVRESEKDKSKISELLMENSLVIIKELCTISLGFNVNDMSDNQRDEINKLLWLKVYPQIKIDIDYLCKKAGLPHTGLSKDLDG